MEGRTGVEAEKSIAEDGGRECLNGVARSSGLLRDSFMSRWLGYVVHRCIVPTTASGCIEPLTSLR